MNVCPSIFLESVDSQDIKYVGVIGYHGEREIKIGDEVTVWAALFTNNAADETTKKR